MARKIQEIQDEIFASITANENLAELNSNSQMSIYGLFSYIISSAIWIHEQFFDQHQKEINMQIINQKTGRLPWYKTMALRFQDGFDLVPDKDYFDNKNASLAEIEASKIIKYAAVNEAEDSSRVIVKIAGEKEGVLSNFEDLNQVEKIEAYFNEIRVAGVQVTVINYKADKLYLTIQVKRDALVLNKEGMNREAKYPVVDALKQFMKELDFNGELRLSALIDKIQLVPGVIDATVISASSAWIDPLLNGYGLPQPILVSKIAESGYFEIETFKNIAYVV